MTTPSAPRRFFSAPVFPEDEDKTRLAYYINLIVPASIVTLILVMITRVRRGANPLETSVLMLGVVIVVLLIAWAVLKSGAVRRAAYLTIDALALASTYLSLSANGLRGAGFASFFVVMLLAGLLLGARAAIGVAVLAILSGFGLAYAETSGLLVFPTDEPLVAAVKYAVLFVMSAVIIRSIIHNLKNALDKAEENARELAVSNTELTTLRDDLELRIQERTASLERRASQLQAVSSMARNITAIKDLDSLLPNTTQLVSEQFGFYHAGIFLLDEAREAAVLKATNSLGGSRMLVRGHRLPLDSNSIVGYAASHAEPRIALDVGADSVYFNNPDLPETRSEMALPLLTGGQVIGVLDVQSREKNAFVPEDIFVLATLADQIAVAIENARLHDESRQALAESKTTFERYVRQQWSTFAEQARHTGFMYDGKQVIPLDKKGKREQIPAGLQTGKTATPSASPTVSLPIKLRGQTIGFLDVRSKRGDREWTQGEITLLEAAAERAGLALENARLVESAQRRAARERSIGEISAKIGAVSDIDSILQTAVEELGRKLSNAAEVTLEIDTEQIQSDPQPGI
jgi:GAF domain-containing protein